MARVGLFLAPAMVLGAPGAGEPLELVRGEVHPIADVAELETAVENANRSKLPVTLLLQDGTYILNGPGLEIACPGLVIRSARGDRDRVIVRGPDEGPKAEVKDVFLVSTNDVVIADLTLGYCRYHGIQVRGEAPFDVSGLLVHNCRIVNCNEQFIKGSSSDDDPVGATDGRVEECLFEFTSGWAFQFYTGGIDIHKGVNWIIRDNTFRNIRVPAGQPGMAEHAIHFWKRCPTRPQNIVVEGNWIENCDRGIGFGLGDEKGGLQGGASVIRNNHISNDGAGPHTDVGIGLESASNVEIENNLVLIQKYWAPVEYRFRGSSNLVIRGNIVSGPIETRDHPPPARRDDNLECVLGSVNGAYVEHGGRSIAVYGDPSGQRSTPDLVLLAEARRDVSWATRRLARNGAKVIAPERESALLAAPERFWSELRDKRFHDYSEQWTKAPAEAMPVSRQIRGGDTVDLGNLKFRVLDTPGYTKGAVSYLVMLGGNKIAFTGDLIRDDGKLQDLFSLQDVIPETKTDAYHGWAARLEDLVASLETVAREQPDLVVPLRGPVISEPAVAIRRLEGRIRTVYSNYLSIDALRWYFNDDHIRAKAKRVLGPDTQVNWMPTAELRPLPETIIPISNSRLILSSDGSGFLVDCGGVGIVQELRKLRAAGKLTALKDVFVTHYHDDHTDALPALVQEFGARVHACGSLTDLIEHPQDYRLPCLTRNSTRVTARHSPGDSWRWKEYQFTIFDFPGQTLYHNAMLVERAGGWKAFFLGDSFTPSGIDDYCLQNRNWLHPGEGYLLCLDQLEKLPPDCFLINEHVAPAFRFSTAQIRQMREALRQRYSMLSQLLPFDDPNYGLDESWAALHPYWIALHAGDSAELELRIRNHSAHEKEFRAAVHPPKGFQASQRGAARIQAHTDGVLRIEVQAPANSPPGLQVLTTDVGWDENELREWAEAVIEIIPQKRL
jgi:glyoxylase-like metal-dependent hydrolase (beta-lactamase superfamily II)